MYTLLSVVPFWPAVKQEFGYLILEFFTSDESLSFELPTTPITYYWTLPLILDHSTFVGKLTS
jgi:hypothetical protein